MPFLKPLPPPYKPFEWQALPWPERLKLSCQAWAVQGYGAPFAVYLFYLAKIAFYVAMWMYFCSFSAGLGEAGSVLSWCFEPVAFQKAVLWSLTFEGLGLGCASGPLTGRYHPVVGGFLHFLRPGTTKLPLFPGLPLLGGSRRTALEAALYALHVFFLLRALVAPELSPELLWPIVLLLPILGVSDKTLFLVHRPEHYYLTVICFLFVEDWIAGAMAVQLAIWLWAAVSKLNPHFPAVVAVMVSNSPVLPFQRLRKAMYRDYPQDLRPSRLATRMAHFGTALECTFPILLALNGGGWSLVLGLSLMVAMHLFITSNIPMAVPLEWNVHVVYGAFFLFWANSGVAVWEVSSPLLVVILLLALVVVPLVGNLWPARVSFLLSMRYYAGNWAYGIWLFRQEGETYRKLDAHLVKAARWVPDQLARMYDEETIVGLLGKVPAFRAMHLHGRALQTLLPRAVEDVEDYQYVDGEMVAGMVLGWNFGDGHLHSEQLLASVQESCDFAPGDLRCIFVESQPLGGASLEWRIVDACTGPIDSGSIRVEELQQRQPWPLSS